MTWKCSTTFLKSVKEELYFINKEKTETYRGKGSGKKKKLKGNSGHSQKVSKCTILSQQMHFLRSL